MEQSIPLSQKFNLLKMVVDESHIHLIMDKILKEIKNNHQQNIDRYNKDLKYFESKYEMDSNLFYEKFEKGQLGDEMDYFEWSGLIELRNELFDKVKILETNNECT